MFPKAVIAVPLLILLFCPAIVSLLILLLRTFYTVYADDVDDQQIFEPLDLINNESHRQFFLLPVSVSGFVITILPAYYINRGKYYPVLSSLGVLGFLSLGFSFGVAFISEKSFTGILNPIHKKIKD